VFSITEDALIMAALFHDTGMAMYELEDADKVRTNHSKISTGVLDKYFEDKMQLIPTRDRLKAAIAFACEAHGMSTENLYSCSIYKEKDKIDADDVRFGLLASLIRVGDLLDLDSKRVNEFVLSRFSSKFSKESLEHQCRHLRVDKFYYSPTNLKVEVTAESLEQFKIWSGWLQWLKDEVLHINTYLGEYGIIFPVLEKKVNIPEDADFEIEELRFEIDDSGGIWKILSQSIYTDELDFLRELVQNAIDATLFKYYLNSEIELSHQSPRSWSIDNQSNIVVAISAKRKELYVIDRGVGMNDVDLKRFLFKISSSGYANADNRDFPFPSIAKFGIGFVSCLINATEIEIYTRKENALETHYVSLSSSNNEVILQKKKLDNDFQGTVIKLNLKSAFSFTKIVDYLSKKFIFHNVNIFAINLDDLKSLSEHMGLHGDFECAVKKPFLLVSYFDKIDEKRKGMERPLQEIDIDLREISYRVTDLKNWIYEIQESDEKYPDTIKFRDFKEKLKSILVHTEKYNNMVIRFPLLITEVNQKTLFNDYALYIEKMESYDAKIAEFAVSNREKLHLLHAVGKEIDGRSVSYDFSWKYCVVLLISPFVTELL